MSRKFNINLADSSTIKKAIQELNQYITTDIDKACQLFVEELGKKGVDLVSQEIMSLDMQYSTGELLASTRLVTLPRIPYGYSCLIINDCDHAAFVEFGTGYIGEEHPYPKELPDSIVWEYKVGEQIRMNAEKGIYGWWYRGDDGQVHFTKGMQSRPFMTNADIKLISIVEKTARQVFHMV